MKLIPSQIGSILTINASKGKWSRGSEIFGSLLNQFPPLELNCCIMKFIQCHDAPEKMKLFWRFHCRFRFGKKLNWAEKGLLIALWDFAKWDKLQPLLLASNV